MVALVWTPPPSSCGVRSSPAFAYRPPPPHTRGRPHGGGGGGAARPGSGAELQDRVVHTVREGDDRHQQHHRNARVPTEDGRVRRAGGVRGAGPQPPQEVGGPPLQEARDHEAQEEADEAPDPRDLRGVLHQKGGQERGQARGQAGGHLHSQRGPRLRSAGAPGPFGAGVTDQRIRFAGALQTEHGGGWGGGVGRGSGAQTDALTRPRLASSVRRDRKEPDPTESDAAPAGSYRVSDAPSADPTERHPFAAQPTSVGPRAARRLPGHTCPQAKARVRARQVDLGMACSRLLARTVLWMG